MDTTTPVDGVASDQAAGNSLGSQVTEPTTTEAVADDNQTADASTVDDTSTSQDKPTADAVSGETSPSETQADDIEEWAKKKGLPMDDPKKLAAMYRDAEKKMHEATTQAKVTVTPPEEVALTGNESIDEVIARQNVADLKLYVRDWFDANPDMKEHRQELTKIASERPWLQDMDDVKAHFLADPSRSDQLKREGGREALTNLAQKQQAVPPSANATNATVFESSKITPENVDELVAKNDSAWYDANRDAIRQAAFGNTRT